MNTNIKTREYTTVSEVSGPLIFDAKIAEIQSVITKQCSEA